MALTEINELIKIFEPVIYPIIVKDIDYDKSGIEIEIMDRQCFLLRNMLNVDEQMKLFGDLKSKDKTPKKAVKVMYPSPQTIVYDENKVSLYYTPEQNSVYNHLVNKANDIINRNHHYFETNVWMIELNKYKLIKMSAIKYPSPNGHFAPHIDHDNSFVYLASIGCIANFMVKGPNMKNKKVFKFNSGDLLIFNASTKAANVHGVISIDNTSSCPVQLANEFQILKNHRIGIQCRVQFQQFDFSKMNLLK
eukprot:220609_1